MTLIRGFPGFKIRYRENTVDSKIMNGSIIARAFLKHEIDPGYVFRKGHVIIDVGAHIGVFAMLAAAKVGKRGRVYAIEPCRENFRYLKQNVNLNGFENISLFRIALSGFNGRTELYHDQESWGHTTTKAISSDVENVKACTLESFMKRLDIKRCNLLKINCEGAEFDIIASMPDEFLKRICFMFILYHTDLVDGYKLSDLVRRLHSCDFSTRIKRKKKARGLIIAGPGNYFL